MPCTLLYILIISHIPVIRIRYTFLEGIRDVQAEYLKREESYYDFPHIF